MSAEQVSVTGGAGFVAVHCIAQLLQAGFRVRTTLRSLHREAEVHGPVLGPNYSGSILIVERLMHGAVPGCPRIVFGVVDARDVADLHLRAMTDPAARGERFIACGGDYLAFAEIARILRARMGSAAARDAARELPDGLTRIAALLIRDAALLLPELGKQKNASAAKAERLLGWRPRPREEALSAAAESLPRLGLLRGGKAA